MTDRTNPKDALGAKKIDLNLVPTVGIVEEAKAMTDGAIKYDPYNWREKHVRAQVYIAAMKRHIALYEAGEDHADDSRVHHLGHVRSCANILLDAEVTGCLIDDRRKSNAVVQFIKDSTAWVLARFKQEQDKPFRDIALREVPEPKDYLVNHDVDNWYFTGGDAGGDAPLEVQTEGEDRDPVSSK